MTGNGVRLRNARKGLLRAKIGVNVALGSKDPQRIATAMLAHEVALINLNLAMKALRTELAWSDLMRSGLTLDEWREAQY